MRKANKCKKFFKFTFLQTRFFIITRANKYTIYSTIQCIKLKVNNAIKIKGINSP